MTLPLAILRTGAVTSAGLNAPSTFAALRTRLNSFDETSFVDGKGAPVIAGTVSLGENRYFSSIDKQVAMLVQAIHECLIDLPWLDVNTLPLLLCVAEVSRKGRLKDLESSLHGGIQNEFKSAFSRDSAIYAYGQAGAMVALNDAFKLSNSHPFVLIAGVDSLVNPATLRAMLDDGRVLNSTTPQGFIPGEAACAVLIGSKDSICSVEPRFSNVYPNKSCAGAQRQDLFCTGLGIDRELAIIGSDSPNKATALSAAIKAALAGMPENSSGIGLRISTQSSEDFYAKEFAIAAARTDVSVGSLWMLADSLGETGAAAGLLAIAWAYASAHKGYLPSMTMLCLAASDEGERAAALLCFGEFNT